MTSRPNCFVAAHPQDATWMIGEPARFATHAFRTTGYNLTDIRNFAAGQGLTVLAIRSDGILAEVGAA